MTTRQKLFTTYIITLIIFLLEQLSFWLLFKEARGFEAGFLALIFISAASLINTVITIILIKDSIWGKLFYGLFSIPLLIAHYFIVGYVAAWLTGNV